MLHLRHALRQVHRGAPITKAAQHVGVQLRDAPAKTCRLGACDSGSNQSQGKQRSLLPQCQLPCGSAAPAHGVDSWCLNLVQFATHVTKLYATSACFSAELAAALGNDTAPARGRIQEQYV